MIKRKRKKKNVLKQLDDYTIARSAIQMRVEKKNRRRLWYIG